MTADSLKGDVTGKSLVLPEIVPRVCAGPCSPSDRRQLHKIRDHAIEIDQRAGTVKVPQPIFCDTPHRDEVTIYAERMTPRGHPKTSCP